MPRKLTADQLEWLSDKCDDLDLNLRTDYAGRGNYESPGVGIVCESHELGLAALLMAAALSQDSTDMDWDDVLHEFANAPAPQIDSLGLSSIAYWPSLSA